jgi:hypothetical protein
LLTVGMLALIRRALYARLRRRRHDRYHQLRPLFTSGYLAGYTELWSAAIFLAGIVLIIIEIIVPGFGIFGISA